jgi:glycosyltransferase involved in cell wall biosynthesis
MGFYQRANVLVLPSICFESFGLVVSEAMAFGRPVIGSNVGGISDLIEDGVNGFLVAPGKEQELAEKVCTIIGNRQLALNMGERGKRIIIEKFNAKTHLKKIEEIYHAAVKKS